MRKSSTNLIYMSFTIDRATFCEKSLFHFQASGACLRRILCFCVRNRLLFLFHENKARGPRARAQGPGPWPRHRAKSVSAKSKVLEHIRGSAGSARINRKGCQQLQLRPPLTHAPGARMTVVKQTPSSYMDFKTRTR